MAQESEREDGFYPGICGGELFVVAEWCKDRWFVTGNEVEESPDEIVPIGPRITRESAEDTERLVWLATECTIQQLEKIWAQCESPSALRAAIDDARGVK